ncbi:MAG TPA: MliC family protein [Pararobbsia sp.]|nr:MliC family protein [Pararobbsia sp.]
MSSVRGGTRWFAWAAAASAAALLTYGATACAEDQPAATHAAQVPSAPPPGGKLLPLTFPSLKVVSRSVVTYRCDDGRELGVAYMNTDNQQSFAVIRLDGRHLVFVNVLAGSGARYTADKYVWWSKGPEGDLYDLTKGENAAPIAKDCKALTQ